MNLTPNIALILSAIFASLALAQIVRTLIEADRKAAEIFRGNAGSDEITNSYMITSLFG